VFVLMSEEMSTAFPKSLSKNPDKFADFVRAYALPSFVGTIVVQVLITGLCQLGSWLLTGLAACDGLVGILVPWALALACILLMCGTKWTIEHQPDTKVPFVYWVQSTVQLWWMGSIIWYATTPLALAMFFVLSAGAVSDARYFYDSAEARLGHLVPWLLFPLLLLAIDAFGGAGLLARYAVDPMYVKYATCILIGVLLLVQFVIGTIGRQCYETDASLFARSKLESQLAEAKREREVLRRSCDLMVHGVSAGSFSHDVASPLSLVTMAAEDLAQTLADLPEGTALADVQRALAPILQQLLRATDRVTEMTAALARSLRRAEAPAAMRVDRLVADALDAMKFSLGRHGLHDTPAPSVELEQSDVFIVPGHSGALANVLVNGSLQAPGEPLVIRGRGQGEWYYAVTVRDFGVGSAERPQALADIQASLSLEPDAPSHDVHNGKRYGIALMLAKLLVVRYGGWLEVSSPEQGPGLVFTIVLPRQHPESIPDNVAPPTARAPRSPRVSGMALTIGEIS
jgi:signal transduction histidine kinase